MESEASASTRRRREETAERIVDTALRLLSEEGLEALTIQRIAGELDYAVGALYRYFKSKDVLLVAVLRRITNRVQSAVTQTVAQAMADTERDEKDRHLLAALCVAQVYVELARRGPAEFHLVAALVGDPRELLGTADAAPLLPALVELLLEATAVLQAAQDHAALSKGEAAARTIVLWASLQGVLQLRKLGRFDVAVLRLEQHLPCLLETLYAGWGADRERLSQLLPRSAVLAQQASFEDAAGPDS